MAADENFYLHHKVWCSAKGGGTYLVGHTETLKEAEAVAHLREKSRSWDEVWVTDDRHDDRVVYPMDEYEVVTKVQAVNGTEAQEKVRAGGIRPDRSRNLRWMEPFK